MRYLSPAFVLPVLLVLTGCALTENQPIAADANGAAMRGSVYGGQQPVTGSTVSLVAMGTTGYGMGATVLATTTTDANGNFNFATGSYTCPFANTPVYLTAAGGNSGYTNNPNIMLAAGIGPCSGAAAVNLNLNEVTTAATAFALSHFFTTTLGTGSTDGFGGTSAGGGVYNTGMVMANTYTIPALVSIPDGTALPSTAAVTREAAKLNTLANIIAACVNSAGGTIGSNTPCGTLFQATSITGGLAAPSDTLQAAVQIALRPYQNVDTLYSLPPATSPFIGLSAVPNDFTLALSYNSSAFGLGISNGIASGSASNLSIDATGGVWFPTNSATSHGIGHFDPTTSTFSGPYATQLVHPQYITIDNAGMVYASDLGSPLVAGVSTTNPTGPVTTHTLNSGSTVGPIQAASNAATPNALVYAVTGATTNLWIEQNGNQGQSTQYTYPPTGIAPYIYKSPAGYYEVESATSNQNTNCLLEAPYTDGNQNYPQTIVTGPSPCISGGLAQLNEAAGESAAIATTQSQICSYNAGTCFAPSVPLSSPIGIAFDGGSNVWIANAGNASVSTLLYNSGTGTSADYQTTSPVAYLHGNSQGSTMTTPYGIAIDRSGNVWVQNAGCNSPSAAACTPGSFVLSEMIGAASPTLTPLITSLSTTNGGPALPNLVYTPTHADAALNRRKR